MSENYKLKQYIFVIRQLVRREMKRKYSRSYLGIVWSVLNPLLTMIVMSIIFSTMFQRSIENYPIYLLTGTMLWSLFTSSTSTAMTAVVDNRGMLMKVKFPKMIFPISRIYTAVVNFGYTLIAYALIFVFFQIPISKKLILVPFIIVFLLLFITGMSYILSTLYVFFGDIKHLYSVILTLWMYCSALFYPIESVPQYMQIVIMNNPMYNYISCIRKCVLYQQIPSTREFAMMILWGVGLYIIGYVVFKKHQNKMMQIL